MDTAGQVQKDGFQWLLGAGLFAVLLAAFVAWSDHRLSTSDSEEQLRRTLFELRSAQHSLPSGSIDPRQGNTLALREPPAAAVLAAGRPNDHHDASHHGVGTDAHAGH